jgi:hypothetical protein
MAYFQTKKPYFGKFWRVLQWKMLVHFMTIWSILRPLGIFCGHLVNFMVIWNIFPLLVCCTNKNLATPFFSSRNSSFIVIMHMGPYSILRDSKPRSSVRCTYIHRPRQLSHNKLLSKSSDHWSAFFSTNGGISDTVPRSFFATEMEQHGF